MTDSAAGMLAEEAEPVYLVYGTVLSGSGIPLSGVSISVLGNDKNSFETDSEGDFKISVDDPSDIIRFSYRGISDIDVPVADRSHLIVTLSSSGNRVQAIGEDGRELPASSNASPGGGYSAYKTYLQNKVGSMETDGRIVVEFTVGKNGDLTDFEIVRGVSEQVDKALIEAMQNGPKWQPAFEQGMAVPSRTRYRIKLR
jgi:TonB family protein